jgi:hypothetical protein
MVSPKNGEEYYPSFSHELHIELAPTNLGFFKECKNAISAKYLHASVASIESMGGYI